MPWFVDEWPYLPTVSFFFLLDWCFYVYWWIARNNAICTLTEISWAMYQSAFDIDKRKKIQRSKSTLQNWYSASEYKALFTTTADFNVVVVETKWYIIYVI